MRARRVFAIIATGCVVAGSVTGSVPAAEATTSQKASVRTAAQYRIAQRAQVRRGLATSTSRAATLKAVTQAVRSSEFTSGVPASDYTVRDLRTSGAWATVTLAPRRVDELDAATALLKRAGSRWTVVELGTAGVGCEVVPAAARTPLRLECGD